MAVNRNAVNLSYGFNNPLQYLNPQPIFAASAPTSADKAPLGTFWFYKVPGSPAEIYILTSSGTWTQVATSSGGAGVFTSLEVNGDSEFNGDINVSTFTTTGALVSNASGDITDADAGTSGWVLTSNGAGSPPSFQAVGGSGVFTSLTVNGTTALNGALTVQSGTAAINIGTDNTNKVITIGAGIGTSINMVGFGGINIGSDNANTSQIAIGNNSSAFSSVTLRGGSASSIAMDGNISLITSSGGGLTLNCGSLSLTPTNGALTITSRSSTAAAFTVTNNSLVGRSTLTGQTINMGSSQAITLNNSSITATTTPIITICNDDVSTNGAFLTVDGIVLATGSAVINVTNNGAGNLAATDTIYISFIVLS